MHIRSHVAANTQIKQDLHASGSDISLSLSVFILVQGLFPLVWSAISEIKGRKVCPSCTMPIVVLKCHVIQVVYLSSMSLFVVGSAVVATSKTIGLVIGMRALQAMGWVHILVSISRLLIWYMLPAQVQSWLSLLPLLLIYMSLTNGVRKWEYTMQHRSSVPLLALFWVESSHKPSAGVRYSGLQLSAEPLFCYACSSSSRTASGRREVSHTRISFVRD